MSRFVTAGGEGEDTTERDEAWSKAQQQIEATKQKEAIASQQQGGRSLFETLQANKAAKQEEFEEATRLRNQFRSLDEDEVDFLDSVSRQSRTKEIEVRKETREQLQAFRQQQDEAEKAARQEKSLEDAAQSGAWSVSTRKRKKGREMEGIGRLKLRRVSTADDKDEGGSPESSTVTVQALPKPTAPDIAEDNLASLLSKTGSTTPSSPPPGLGLGAYSSDEEP
ncbi:hypothetical protein LTR53_001080 [Teratosphaeriaceae sp. CCFEE 6253]|nr:hypothetical protein LTR53_001080 [Teratosphaeriaceae sp. CCFEE 6253]